MTTQLSDRIDQLTRSRVALRAGDRRARPGAELRACRRPRDRARRRLHRGVRRRPVRRRVGADRRPRRPGDRGGRAAAGAARPDGTFPQTPGCEHRGQPVPVRRSVGDLPRAAAPVTRAVPRRRRRRPPRRWPPSAPTLGFVVDRAVRGCPPAGAIAAVVSSHGGDEPGAIRAALDAGVGFVGLVCSHTRGQALLEELDLSEDELRRVHPHVGLDIGARTAPEIALSIMAAIVREHPARGPDAAAPASRSPSAARPSTRSAA